MELTIMLLISILIPSQKQSLNRTLTYQVWQGDMTWSPGKYSFPLQVHGQSSGRKHASPCLSKLWGHSKQVVKPACFQFLPFMGDPASTWLP